MVTNAYHVATCELATKKVIRVHRIRRTQLCDRRWFSRSWYFGCRLGWFCAQFVWCIDTQCVL